MFSKTRSATLRGSTMRLWSVPPLLLALLWILASVAQPLRAADDPGDGYMQVYKSFQDAAKLETDGKLDEALQKYRFCISLLEQIQRTAPAFYPLMVDLKLRKSREAIARVQSMQQAPSSVDAASLDVPASVPAPSQPPPPVRIDRFPLTYRVPVIGQPSPPPVYRQRNEAADTADQVMGRGAINALKDELDTLRAQLDEKNQSLDDLHRQLLESTAREQSEQKEVDLWKVRAAEQQSQLAQMRQSLDDLQQANGQLSRERESDQRRIAGLQADLDAARADLEVADEYNGELFAKLGQAAKFIDADEKIRTQLLAERKELSASLGQSSSDAAKLEKDRAAAVAKSGALQKQLGDATAAADQNKALSKKLAAAEKQLADLSKDNDERRKIESGLRDEAASVNKTLASMRGELKTGQTRIAELEKQLSDTAGASANVTGEMAGENALLKSIVTRQLKEQVKRQQARKLVEEEMEKLQIRSSSLLEKLDTMAGSEASLTSAEKKLVDPHIVAAGGHSDFALEVVKKTPESDLPPDLVARASQANELAQKRQFSEAKDIYAEIAKKAPQSYLAAVNLGIAQRQLGDYPQAIDAFKRALELKHDDPFALTNLGVVQYRNGDLAAAAKVLKQAVTADSGSYLAHYLLGMTLNDQGDHAGARREVQQSLDLKPDYAPAMELSGELGGASLDSTSSKASAKATQ